MPPTPKTMCALNIHFQIVKMWGHLMVMPCDTRWWHEVSLPSLYHLNAITEIPRVNEKPGSHGQDYRPPSAKKPSDKLLEYECPYCHVAIYSTVESGNVKTTGHCGKQFRVRGGVVARSFAHACPKCGQQIQSSKESGRIQSTHKTPDGNTCTKASWVIK